MLVGLIVRKPAQQFQFVHVPTKEENVSSQLPGGGGGGTCYIYIRGVRLRMKDKIQTPKNGFTVNFEPKNIVILHIFYPKIWVTILF